MVNYSSRLFPFRVFAVLSLALVMLTGTSCSDEEKFPTDAKGSLWFSTDTLEMDTVISGQVSPTRRMVIRNQGSDGLRITGVSFLQGKSDGFRVIVDGISVTDSLLVPIDCRSGDSLIVFIQALLPQSGQDHPVHHEAVLEFTLANGIRQNIYLSAWGQDVIPLNHVVFASDASLPAGKPYLVYDSLVVASGATLTMNPGVRLMFRPDAYMRIDGGLIAQGTLESPIIFRGERMDYMFTNQPYDRISGQWQGLVIGTGSTGILMDYCDIHSGSYGLVFEDASLTGSQPLMTVRNSIIHNVSGNGIEAWNTRLHVGNSQITNAGGACVALYGGNQEFIHCTIGQFYPFSALSGPALYFTNTYSNKSYPLVKADFINCIITGYSDDEIIGESSGKDEDTYPFQYKFSHCLLNTPETVDTMLIDNVWESKDQKVMREDNFSGFDLPSLTYGFQLDSLSPAIGIGDISVSSQYYPKDRLGKFRLKDNRSDAGCYEFE